MVSFRLITSLLIGSTVCVATDFDTVNARRRSDIASAPIALSYARNATYQYIPTWISTLQPDGHWLDVNYSTGCAADRASPPILEHFARIVGLAQAWSGLNPNISSSYAGAPDVWNTATKALDYWFHNDYNNTACLVDGGKTACPCSTPGFWNTNWYYNGIGAPTTASQACFLLSSGNLTAYQKEKCLQMGLRGSNYSKDQVLGPTYQTAANAALILQNVVSAALYSNNATLLGIALQEAMGNYKFIDDPSIDGIHRDGSFLQHTGQLYTGNYGVEFLKVFISLQGEAVGTSYSANTTVQEAVSAFLRGADWEIFTNKADSKLYWDLSVVGRFIARPRSDGYATKGVGIDVNALATAVSDFAGGNGVNDVLARLQQQPSAVALSGNKAYYASDYMVHRRPAYTLFNKMISTRGQNQEYINSDNTMAYHMSQGHLFTWVDGTEYQDIAGAWDWYLIPGSTVLYHNPTLSSSWVGVSGKKDFVGVISDGTNGFSVMDYVDPHDGSISYRRTWVYIGDLVLNTIVNATRNAGTAPIVTVLDQRLSSGSISINGTISIPGAATAKTLRYGQNGYFAYSTPFALTTADGPKSGDWSMLGNSKTTTNTANIFSAYHTIPNGGSFSYAQLPASTADQLASQAAVPSVKPLNSTGATGAVGPNYIAIAFWPNATSQSEPIVSDWSSQPVTISTSAPAIILASKSGSTVTVNVADPTQKLSQVTITLAGPSSLSCGTTTGCSGGAWGVSLTFDLPSGGSAGKSVTKTISI